MLHQPRPRHLFGRLFGLLLFAAALLAACGSSETASPAATAATDQSPAETTTATTAAPAETTTTTSPVPAVPQRIVSLSPTSTEVLFAIGAGAQVIAADEFSTYPPEAPRIAGLSGFTPNVEAIADLEPDLVVMSSNSIAEELENLGIGVLVHSAPTDIFGVYDQILEMGVITGNETNAAAVVEEMRNEAVDLTLLATEATGYETTPSPFTFFHELDDTFFTVTSDTFVGSIYQMTGLMNIADVVENAAGGYPQISAEFVLDADPDFIFFADGQCCGQSVETISSRPGWDALRAVQNGNVIEVNEDIASRWGPRTIDFLRSVVEALQAAAPLEPR